MKYFIIYIFLFVSVLFSKDFDIEKVVAQVNSIKESNQLSPNLEYKVYDPFATAKPILKEKKRKGIHKTKVRRIIPQTILNGEVFIDKKWYAIGDVIRGYKIKNINKRSISLYKNGLYKKVYLKSSKNVVKIEEKIE
jgi:hypothetical protein